MSTDRQHSQDRFPWEEAELQESLPLEQTPEPVLDPAATTSPETWQDEPAQDAAQEDPPDVAMPAHARHVAQKEYYSISEVCDLVDLKPHVLRYWETQFQVLNPSKNRSGNRVYQRKEIKLILLVKHLLYEEKYTVEGAKAKLDKLRRTGGIRESTASALGSEMVTLLREDMQRLLDILGPRDTA
jgi:DNA-binding transcriptional MerR regulator